MSAITQKDIAFAISSGEGLSIEFKENLSHVDRAMVAMANAEGGKIFIGINDQKKIIGIEITNSLKSRIQDIARNCDPPLDIKIESHKKILIIEVPEGANKPYKCADGFFLRIGPNSQKMGRNEILDLLIKEGRAFFDDQINDGFDATKEINSSAVREFLYLAEVKTFLPYADVLVNLGAAVRQGKKLYFKNAGTLFFAKNPQRELRHCNMTCVAFKDKAGVEASDRKDLSGTFLEIVAEAEKFVLRNIKTGFRIKGFRRENLPEYPIEAVREGFVNALMHRDYFERGANVLLKIFPGKIVIDNPGGLVKGMTVKDLGRVSRSRNPLIADLFHRVNLAEKIGSGIKRMGDLMRQYGLKPPRIEVTEGFFTITFHGFKIPVVTIPSEVGLNARQKKAIEFVKGNGRVTNKEYARINKIGRVQSFEELKALVKKKIFKYVGRGRATFYTFR